MRHFWLGIGCMAVAAAAAGVVLPLVPTTPFLLLAAFAFARSSPRLHRWLVNHRRFGPLIENWRRHGAISRRTKRLAIAAMIVALGASVGFSAPAAILVPQAIVLAGAALFVASRPDGPPRPPAVDQ